MPQDLVLFNEKKRGRIGLIRKDPAWAYFGGEKNSIVVSVDRTIKLHAVRLFGSENNKYSVTLTVTDSSGVALATKVGRFMSQLIQCERGDYQGFDIAFEPPVALQAGIQYSLNASIGGPPSGYGNDGSPRVEHAGVTFFYGYKVGVHTNVSAGQFPELVFQLLC